MSALDMPDFGPAKETLPLRVLLVATSHPELDAGRVSAAAGDLARQLKRRGVSASLLASVPKSQLPPGMRMAAYRHRPDEMLAAFPEIDAFSLASRDAAVRDRLMADLLDHFQPDIVHFQHVDGAGLDACGVVKARGIPVVLTLQEDISASPAADAGKLPGDGPGPAELFARRRLLQLNLADADALVVPHRALAERLAASGVSSGQIHVIANPGDRDGKGKPLPPREADIDVAGAATTGPRLLKARRQALRQIHIGVFLSAVAPAETAMIGEAMEMLPASYRRRLRFSFFQGPAWSGEGSTDQALGDGPGASGGLRKTISGCDWVLIPSLEGDESLQPFQEAASLGVPFLHPGRDDLPDAEALGSIAFDPDAVAHLAHCLLQIADGAADDVSARLAAQRRSDAEALDDYVDLYQHVIARGATRRR